MEILPQPWAKDTGRNFLPEALAGPSGEGRGKSPERVPEPVLPYTPESPPEPAREEAAQEEVTTGAAVVRESPVRRSPRNKGVQK